MINELAPEKVFVRDLPEIDSFKNKNKQRNGGFSGNFSKQITF